LFPSEKIKQPPISSDISIVRIEASIVKQSQFISGIYKQVLR